MIMTKIVTFTFILRVFNINGLDCRPWFVYSLRDVELKVSLTHTRARARERTRNLHHYLDNIYQNQGYHTVVSPLLSIFIVRFSVLILYCVD